jgi:hypothetical protein
MVKKYVSALENREYNTRTDDTWKIEDVPSIWKNKVIAQIEKDGYMIEEDGTVSPIPVNDGE